MKLSRRLLIPIILVSYFAVGLCGAIYYKYMEAQIDSVYRSEIHSTLVLLENMMHSTSAVNEQVMEQVDDLNLAAARAMSDYIEDDPAHYLKTENMQTLAERLGFDTIAVIAPDGRTIGSSHEFHIGSNIAESEEYAFLLDRVQETDLAVVMAPVLDADGEWVQYYVVPRIDEPGLIMAGITQSVSAILQQSYDYGINPEDSRVGETGIVVVLQEGQYTRHPDANKIGEDVSGTEWYAAVSATHEGLEDFLVIDGERYLAGFHRLEEDTILLALLPYAEYHGPLTNMFWFTVILVFVSGAIIIAVLFFLLRNDVIRPVEAMTLSIKNVGLGDYDHARVDGEFHGEMEDLRKGLNKTIAMSQGRQWSIFASYPGVIWSCDAEYTCTLSTGQAMERMKYDPSFYLGRNLVEAMRESGDEESAAMVERTFTEGPQRVNITIAGRYFAMSTSQILDTEGNVIGMVGVAADVTDLHELQERLMKATEDATRASEEANRASAAKSEFLSRMSHEIRTPMNAIIGMNTIARKSEDPAKILYCLDKIQVASDQLLRLINDILDMSKIEANKFEISEAEFDFEKMLQNVCNVVEVNAVEKKQDFIIDFTEVFDRNVVTDEMRLSQVLINLLNNAVKFTPEHGKIILKIRHESVDKSFGRFHFDIVDNGIGISAEQQQRLFSSFEQADGSITRRYGGTGLGLAICKSIIQMLGGDIQLESKVGEGSHFSFSVNMRWGNEKGTKDLIHRLPLGNSRILVIDDNEDVCLYFDNILESYQLSCDTAQSGPQGIHKVREALEKDTPYNLIFVDWMMPGMNGIETARHIKDMVPPETIVIMISVADWSEIEAEAKGIGVDKYLAKPVLPTVLFQSIVAWLNTAAEEKVALEEDAAAASLDGKSMLLAEDIDINREIVVSMLEGTGLHVDCAEDGQQAVDMYFANPGKYDLILMDIQMPGIDGYEATRKIRESGLVNSASIPIVAMTANAFTSDVEKCIAAGMNDHIAKPVGLDDLFSKIHKALR